MSNDHTQVSKQYALSNNLVHYYEVRMASFSDFKTRIWHRFNWFMTMHLGAFALIFSSIVKVAHSDWYTVIAAAVAMTALLWTLLGYADFKHMRKYDLECEEIELALLETIKNSENIDFSHGKIKSSEALPLFSHSRILYMFPMFLFVTWSLLGLFLL